MDALVGIGADLARHGHAVGPLGHEPLVDEVAGHDLAEADLQHGVKPGLGDAQNQQEADDDCEDAELRKKA